PELDLRRELGILVHDREIVHSLVKVFDSDWAGLEPAREKGARAEQGGSDLKKAVKAIVRDLPLAPIVEDALRHAVGEAPKLELRRNDLRHDLTDVVKQAVEDAVTGMVRRRTANV